MAKRLTRMPWVRKRCSANSAWVQLARPGPWWAGPTMTPRWTLSAKTAGASEPTAEELEPPRPGPGRDSKVAVLETYRGAVHDADPDPEAPRCFLDLKRTAEVVR